jgi:hypothetical protein
MVVYNRVLTAFLVCSILKNILMSTILFFSLYRFYTGLRKINLRFEIDKCTLTIHIVAFGMPTIAGFLYVFFIFKFNQVSLFTSS